MNVEARKDLTQPHSPRYRFQASRFWAVGATLALALGAAVSLRTATQDQLSAFPPPPATPSAPTREDFAGSDTCAPCHIREYDAWAQSTHGSAGGAPSERTVIAPFDSNPIRFRDATVIPRVDSTGEYQFVVERVGRAPAVFTVDGVIGRGHMTGGGTQGFVSIFPDGTIRFLPFDFSRHESAWFCNTGPIAGWWTAGALPRRDTGWVPITEDLRLADCGDWPPARILGTNFRFANCQQCHGSQIAVQFDSTTGAYRTELTSLTINCESCHGPRLEHAELAMQNRLPRLEDGDTKALDLLDKNASVAVCFTCHALKRGFREDFMPGARLEDFYSLRGPLFSGTPWFPDGRVRTFGYQQNHVASSCYLDGTMTCVDCHDPHSQGYRDIYGRSLPGRLDDGQCLDCHASKADNVIRHTNHLAESEGSRCVNCHMPYLQHADVGDEVRFARSDHTISIPRPGFDDRLGITNACSLCHQETPADKLTDQMRVWYGETKPHRPIVSALFELSNSSDAQPNLSALLDSEAAHPMAQVTAINVIVTNYLQPDMTGLLPEVIQALQDLARNEDMDVRATALSALHLTMGNDPNIRNFLIRGLINQGDGDYAVRNRWIMALRSYGDAYIQEGEAVRALTVYHKALELHSMEDLILLDIANIHAATGRADSAVLYYQRSLAVSPTLTPGLVNLAVTLERLNRTPEAYETYARAVAINPGETLAHVGLGNLFFQREQYRAAADAYANAVYFDPTLFDVQLYLAQAYLFLGVTDSALIAVQNALEFDPENAVALRMLEDLQEPIH